MLETSYSEVDHNPWGTPYRIVMKKIGKPPPIPPNLIPAIVAELFLVHPKIAEAEGQPKILVPLINVQELELASKRLRPRKVPGPGGVPNEALKVA